MLSIVKRLIGAKPPQPHRAEPPTLTPDTLAPWLERETERALAALTDSLSTQRTAITRASRAIDDALAALETATLMNPHIPSRALQLMEGNRGELLRRVRQELETLSIPSTPEGIPAFLDTVYDSWPAFAKSIARPAAILSEFFAHQIRALSTALHDLESALGALRASYDSSGIPALRTLRTTLDDLRQRNEKAATLEREQRTAIDTLKKLREQRESLIAERDTLQRDPTLTASRTHAQDKENARDALAQRIRDSLSPLEPAFRKYAYIAFHHRKLLEQYAADPVNALAGDVGLKLNDILVGLRRALSAGELELRDRKLEKAQEAIARLTKDELIRLQTSYGHASRDAHTAAANISASPEQRKIDAAARGIGACDEQIAAAERTLDTAARTLKSVDVPGALAALEQQAATLLQGRIRLSAS